MKALFVITGGKGGIQFLSQSLEIWIQTPCFEDQKYLSLSVALLCVLAFGVLEGEFLEESQRCPLGRILDTDLGPVTDLS